MDEQAVADQLKQKLPDGKIDDSYPEPEVPKGEVSHDNLPLENMLLKSEVAEFLGLPRGFSNNPEMTTQLETVLNWAKDLAGTHEVNDIIHVLSKRQGEMGIRDKADKLQRIYQYVKISKQIDGMYERMKTLNG